MPSRAALFESAWNVSIGDEPGLRIPNMFEAALDGSFRALYIQGEDFAQSDPNTSHVAAALSAMECVVVQDLFLVETARYAHVFLPGASFLEKDGTFTNAERRISRVRKVMEPLAGLADWEVTMRLAQALGYPMDYAHPSEIMDEIARLTPTFTGVSYEKLDRLGSIQWPCNEKAPDGTPTMHVGSFVRGKGKFYRTEYVATARALDQPLPAAADHRPRAVPVQRRHADPPHEEPRLQQGRRPRDAPGRRRGPRHQARATWSASRAAPARSSCTRRSPSASPAASSTRPSTSRSPG